MAPQNPDTASEDTHMASFQIGGDSDSEDDATGTVERGVQTEPVIDIPSLSTHTRDSKPRSIEDCLAIFKSDVSI